MRVGLLPRLSLSNVSCLRATSSRLDLHVLRCVRPLPPRCISSSNRLWQDGRARKQHVHLRSEQSESIKPESYQKAKRVRPDDTQQSDALLSEQAVSTQEQRRADWAILKEMARYLWPKVGRTGEVNGSENKV